MISDYIVLCVSISIMIFILSSNTSYNIKVSNGIILSIVFLYIASMYGYRVIDPTHGGIDTDVYEHIYQFIQGKNISVILETRIEFGYSFLMWVAQSVGASFNDFLVVNFLLLILVLYKISKRLPKKIISLLSLILFSLLLIDSFNIIRMVLSTFLLMLGLLIYAENKKVASFFIIILATSIQMTAFIGFLFILYFYLQGKIRAEFRAIFFVVCLIISTLSVYLFKKILISIGYNHYITDVSVFSPLNTIVGAIIFSCHQFYLKKSGFKFSVHYNFIISLIPIIILILPLYLEVPIAYRFNYIFMMFYAFIIPEQILASFHRCSRWKVFGLAIPAFLVTYVTLKLNSFFSIGVYSAQAWEISKSWYIW